VPPPAVPDGVPVPPQAGATAPLEPAQPPAPLPPVESLTPESDFAPFMRDDVDPGLRRQALRTLFRDPRFNVMDGLDVYIDDFSKPDPLPEGWLEKMNQVARLGEYREPDPKAADALETLETRAEDPPEGVPESTSIASDSASPALVPPDTPGVPEPPPEVLES